MSDCTSSNDGYPTDCQILEGYRTRVREKNEAANSKEMQLVLAKASPVKLLLLDVDGVLTDGSLFYSSSGEEIKTFNTQDGLGLRLLQDAGIEVGIITARKSTIVQKRAEELKIRYLYQGAKNKYSAYQDILQKTGFKPFEICYMGDDWLDLVLLQRVGLAVSPANGVEEVRAAAHYITRKEGGNGAVREICNLILKSKGVYEQALQQFLIQG